MKNFTITLLLALLTPYAMAATFTVTLTTDNISAPTPGMLRYYIKNSASGDIIKFAVDRVDLAGSISLSDKSITIDGTERGKVTIDGGALDQIFDITQYSRSSNNYFKNLIFQNGKKTGSYGYGGAVRINKTFGGIVEFDQCIFQNNTAFSDNDAQGGAVRCDGGLFKNCQFLNNTLTGSTNANEGGAVAALGGTFINCLFSGNSAKHGGAVSAYGNSQFYNCTFSQNQCSGSESGGGISVGDASVKFINCIAYNNNANGTINNINQYNNYGIIKNCAFETGNALVGNNENIGLSASPFIGSGESPFALVQGTACINGGTSADITVLPTDLVNMPRVIGTAIDMGAYEFGGSTRIESNTVRQISIFPNPTSGKIYLSEGLSNNATVQIIDVNGKTIVYKRRVDVTEPIDLSGYKGIFIAVIVDGNQSKSETIVVQ